MSEAAVGGLSRESDVRPAEPERGAGYAVYDPVGEKIGIAGQVYVRVCIGCLLTRSVLIPVQFVETYDETETLVLK